MFLVSFRFDKRRLISLYLKTRKPLTKKSNFVLFWFPVEDIIMSDNFWKIQNFLGTSWASIITTYLIKLLIPRPLHTFADICIVQHMFTQGTQEMDKILWWPFCINKTKDFARLGAKAYQFMDLLPDFLKANNSARPKYLLGNFAQVKGHKKP